MVSWTNVSHILFVYGKEYCIELCANSWHYLSGITNLERWRRRRKTDGATETDCYIYYELFYIIFVVYNVRSGNYVEKTCIVIRHICFVLNSSVGSLYHVMTRCFFVRDCALCFVGAAV